MSINPDAELHQLHQMLKNIRRVAGLIATATMTREVMARRIDQITASVAAASAALSALQTEFSNAEITALIAERVRPAPANAVAALGQMNTLWVALRNAYTIEFDGAFESWNGTVHSKVTAAAPNTATTGAMLRDGLDDLLSSSDQI